MSNQIRSFYTHYFSNSVQLLNHCIIPGTSGPCGHESVRNLRLTKYTKHRWLWTVGNSLKISHQLQTQASGKYEIHRQTTHFSTTPRTTHLIIWLPEILRHLHLFREIAGNSRTHLGRSANLCTGVLTQEYAFIKVTDIENIFLILVTHRLTATDNARYDTPDLLLSHK